MKSRYKTVYFPFSPGIPWVVKNSKYIIPKIDLDIWEKAIHNKDIVVACFGGLLESFFSLSYIEMLAKLAPMKMVSWKGNKQYEHLLEIQGLSKPSNIGLKKNHLRQYPTPLFFDAKNNAYMNVLNNYLVSTGLSKRRKVENKEPIVEQCLKNMLMPWDKAYIPRLTHFKDSNWLKDNYLNSKYIIVFPEHELSNHSNKFLKWNVRNVKECGAMLKGFGISTIVVTSNPGLYYGSQVKPIGYDPFVFSLIKKAGVILSSTIDWLIIGMMISKSKIIAQEHDGIFDLYNNADFLNVNNVISTFGDWISPMNVFEEICQK